MSSKRTDSLNGTDGNTYSIKNQKIYIDKFNPIGVIVMFIVFVMYFILYVYDIVKDFFREVSATKDFFEGNFSSAYMKSEGLTEGNMIREFGLFVLGLVLVITFFFSYSKKEVSIDQVPENIKQEYYRRYPPQSNYAYQKV